MEKPKIKGRVLEDDVALKDYSVDMSRYKIKPRLVVIPEDEEDVLESGIEIMAKPPGKEMVPLSLLSGGEKVMTAVALLFALFMARPSPFCVLDEVDAALDDSNIERFLGLVQNFLDRSQFIVISHNKKTMSVADALYGITMDDTGISRKISVNFRPSGEAPLPEAV